MIKMSKMRTVKRFAMLFSCVAVLAVSAVFAANYLKSIETNAITRAGSPVRVSYNRVGTATEPADRVGWVKFRSGWSSPMFLVQPNPTASSATFTAFCLDPNITAPTEGDSYTVSGKSYNYEAVIKDDGSAINNQIKLAVYMATAPSTDAAVSAKMDEWFSLDSIADYWKTDNDQGLNVTDGAYGMRNYKYIMFHALVGYINNNSKSDTDPKKIALNNAWSSLAETEQTWITDKAAELSSMISSNSEIWQTAQKYKLYGLDMTNFEADNVTIQDLAWIEPIPYSMSTYAVDATDEDQYVEASSEAGIVDHVNYCGEESVTYTIFGQVMEKTGSGTGVPLEIDGKEVTASVTVTPTSSSGCGIANMTFDLDASTLAGKELVVFEYMYSGNLLVASHTDINDSLQTVTIISLDTDASDKLDEDKEVLATEDTIVTDHIKYCLTAGTKYTIIGTLMNKETGESLKVNDDTIYNSTSVIPEENCGELDMDFEFDATGLGGTEIVAFEAAGVESSYQLSDDDICVAYDFDNVEDGEDPACSSYFHTLITHADIDDAAQTVLVVDPAKTPETGRMIASVGSSEDGFNSTPIIIASVLVALGGYSGVRMFSRKRFFGRVK